MALLDAKITQIKHNDTLHMVKLEMYGTEVTMISLELSQEIQVGSKVKLSVKPINIAIGRHRSDELSFSNQIPVRIVSVEHGELLSRVVLHVAEDITAESVIAKEAAQRLDLKADESVRAIIKATDLSIVEVYHG